MKLNKQTGELYKYQRKIRIVETVLSVMHRTVTVLMLIVIAFTLSSYVDMYRFTSRGMDVVKYHDFASLLRINPDTCAWLTLDDTRINHPVVQGQDNFEYLDKDFYGKTYAGGTLFLDEHNKPDFSDPYNIIHGHHMEHGAMFGDLEKYLDEDYGNEHRSGELITATATYRLNVIGAGVFDAYDGDVYMQSDAQSYVYSFLHRCIWLKCNTESVRRVLALSTCYGDMSNKRIVVFCEILPIEQESVNEYE